MASAPRITAGGTRGRSSPDDLHGIRIRRRSVTTTSLGRAGTPRAWSGSPPVLLATPLPLAAGRRAGCAPRSPAVFTSTPPRSPWSTASAAGGGALTVCAGARMPSPPVGERWLRLPILPAAQAPAVPVSSCHPVWCHCWVGDGAWVRRSRRWASEPLSRRPPSAAPGVGLRDS
jgi:hypothetical protein